MIRIIHPSTEDEWEAYYELRWRTLRAPWQQPRGTEKDDKEENSIHLFALVDGHPAGVARIQFNDEETAQLRFMGVAEEYRSTGTGKKLLEEAERITLRQGRKKIIMQARETAVPFYQKSGYVIIEKTFLLWNSIQHFMMEKKLED